MATTAVFSVLMSGDDGGFSSSSSSLMGASIVVVSSRSSVLVLMGVKDALLVVQERATLEEFIDASEGERETVRGTASVAVEAYGG